ncbi:MAG: anthranilate synthase component I, partial [Gammaproteobacteria bacterium]|nr:anthranilate synthase component I [Gammaproteobacteria bacterium]
MTPEKYSRLATEGYNHIPVTRELFADLDTPLSCYIKVARGPYSYLLESAPQGGEKWARFSVVGLPSSQILKISGNCFTREINGEVVEQRLSEDPLG